LCHSMRSVIAPAGSGTTGHSVRSFQRRIMSLTDLAPSRRLSLLPEAQSPHDRLYESFDFSFAVPQSIEMRRSTALRRCVSRSHDSFAIRQPGVGGAPVLVSPSRLTLATAPHVLRKRSTNANAANSLNLDPFSHAFMMPRTLVRRGNEAVHAHALTARSATKFAPCRVPGCS